MSYNFGSLANNSGVASDKRLRAYSINNVKFVEAKVDVLHSEKNGTDYDILKIRWENESGYYEENYFLPSTSGKDIERKPNNWGGEMPSNADRAMMFFAHTLSVLNNEGYKKLQKVVGQAKNFKDVATMVAKLLNEKKGISCYLKLTGRANEQGQVFASLPYFAGVSKSGDAYVNNNFLSLKDDLGFTASEDKKRQEFEKVKPTTMNNDEAIDTVSALDSANNADIADAISDSDADDLQNILDTL